MRTVVFLLVPGLHLLDLAGPAQVFSTAADIGLEYRLHYFAERANVPTAQGLPLTASTPGWRAGPAAGSLSPQSKARLAAHHANGGVVASVCAGAEALGQAGLLDNRRCTTHHDLQEDLAARYPKATVVRDVLFVIDDRVVTSAGIASGIDLALHLIAVRHGPGPAARIAREMVVYARRNGRLRARS